MRVIFHACAPEIVARFSADASGSRLGTNGRHVLSVARLSCADAYKGVDALLLAWPEVERRFPDAALTVIGDGDGRARLERLARRLGIGSRVRFRGRVEDADLAQAYASSSVFALPGRARLRPNPEGEGFGLVFLEAATAGLPCVAGRAGGAVEAVEDGVTGFCVDPDKPHEVAAAVVRLLEDPDLARRMGEAGRARVTRDFLYERFRDRIGEFVGSLVKE